MVSPPLFEGLAIPSEQYDEWYLLAEPPPPDWEPEVFVNYGGLTLGPAEELHRSLDPTWDRHILEWESALQVRFWTNLERVNAVTYIAIGEKDVVASRRHDFIGQLRSKASEEPVAALRAETRKAGRAVYWLRIAIQIFSREVRPLLRDPVPG
jgi:hypothetical protein